MAQDSTYDHHRYKEEWWASLFPSRVPLTSDEVLVFPYDQCICRMSFLKTNYYSGMTDNRASLEYVKSVLAQADAICRPRLAGPRWFTLSLTIANLFWVISFILINNYYESFMKVFYVIFALVIVSLFLYKRRAHDAGNKMQEVVDIENAKLKEVGLRWKVPSDFPIWIELHKLYKEHEIIKIGNFVPSPVVTGTTSQVQGNWNYNAPQLYQMP